MIPPLVFLAFYCVASWRMPLNLPWDPTSPLALFLSLIPYIILVLAGFVSLALLMYEVTEHHHAHRTRSTPRQPHPDLYSRSISASALPPIHRVRSR